MHLPIHLKNLVKNCEKNDKIICLNYAVCNNNGKDITFYDAGTNSGISTINKRWLTRSFIKVCQHCV